MTDEDTLIVTVPTTVIIGNQNNVSVIIDELARSQNASTTAALTYTVYGSIENTELSGNHSLPVELSPFTAQDNKGKVLLNWITASETNNAFGLLNVRFPTRITNLKRLRESTDRVACRPKHAMNLLMAI